jgi:CRP-like cAMP-binding protein
METRSFQLAAITRAAGLVPAGEASDALIRQAAWVARCVGRGDAAPLHPGDVTALASTMGIRRYPAGSLVFPAAEPSAGVWIVRSGRLELAVGSGLRRAVVQLLRPGDVDGDIQLLLGMPVPYSARALSDTTCLFLARDDFERLLTRPALSRRWLSSVAQRLSVSQARVLALLGGSLTAQAARLLTEEAVDSQVELPQRTLAAMLGVRRPSLNKVLKDLERRHLIRISYGLIDITDAAGLARMS